MNTGKQCPEKLYSSRFTGHMQLYVHLQSKSASACSCSYWLSDCGALLLHPATRACGFVSIPNDRRDELVP